MNGPFNLYFLQDNIVCLPPKLAQILGNISPICICTHVTQLVHLIDPNTLQGQLFIACHNDDKKSLTLLQQLRINWEKCNTHKISYL